MGCSERSSAVRRVLNPITFIGGLLVGMWAITRYTPEWVSGTLVGLIIVLMGIYVIRNPQDEEDDEDSGRERNSASWHWTVRLLICGMVFILLGMAHLTLQILDLTPRLAALPVWMGIWLLGCLIACITMDWMLHITYTWRQEIQAILVGLLLVFGLYVMGARINALSAYGWLTVSLIHVFLGLTMLLELGLLQIPNPLFKWLGNAVLSGLWLSAIVVGSLGLLEIYERISGFAALMWAIGLTFGGLIYLCLGVTLLVVRPSEDREIVYTTIANIVRITTAAVSLLILALIYLR